MKVLSGLIVARVASSAVAWVPALPQALYKTALATSLMSTKCDFTGEYSDPNHPNCKRKIEMDGNVAIVSGTDGDPDCPPDGSGEPWSLKGKVEDDSILVDFSPKGGPNDLNGKWEEEPKPGIRWPDGNLWALKK